MPPRGKLPSVSPKQVRRALEKDGWTESRQRGSHLVMRKAGKKAPVVLPMHKKDVPRGTLASILRSSGISRRRFLEVLGRVDDWRGGLGSAPFPVAAHRTGRAISPHPALGRDHAFAHGRLAVRTVRRVSAYSSQSRSSGKRTLFPDLTLCFRHSHWRSRRVACRSIAA